MTSASSVCSVMTKQGDLPICDAADKDANVWFYPHDGTAVNDCTSGYIYNFQTALSFYSDVSFAGICLPTDVVPTVQWFLRQHHGWWVEPHLLQHLLHLPASSCPRHLWQGRAWPHSDAGAAPLQAWPTRPGRLGFTILSFVATPHIHRSILISFSSRLFSWLFVVTMYLPHTSYHVQNSWRASFCHMTLHWASSNFATQHSPYVLSPYPHTSPFSSNLCVLFLNILTCLHRLQVYKKTSYFVSILDALWQSLVLFFVPYLVSNCGQAVVYKNNSLSSLL